MIVCEAASDLNAYLAQVSAVVGRWRDEEEHPPEWQPWFRGEPEYGAKSALRPSLYRESLLARGTQLGFEQELRLEFRRRGMQMTTQPPTESWEWYFLMQHYGVPTRLLDWTDGALVALYFAVKDGLNEKHRVSEKPVVVYILDPWWLNDCAFSYLAVSKNDRPAGVALPDWEEALAYLPEELKSESLGPMAPLAIDPPHFEKRVAAQGSRFVVFGRHRNGLVALSKKPSARIVAIPVEKKSLKNIQRDLKLCGISETSIFPDLEGLGRDLKTLWSEMCEVVRMKILAPTAKPPSL